MSRGVVTRVTKGSAAKAVGAMQYQEPYSEFGPPIRHQDNAWGGGFTHSNGDGSGRGHAGMVYGNGNSNWLDTELEQTYELLVGPDMLDVVITVQQFGD